MAATVPVAAHERRTKGARAGSVGARGYGGGVRFGVLGPLAVRTEAGEPVLVREPKVRALLAVLVLHAGGPVPLGRLVDTLWDGAAPADPANTVQTKISQLRRVLDRAEPGARALVARGGGGYTLDVDPDAVDVRRFDRLTTRAAATTDPARRACLLGEALALWRGEPFTEFDLPALAAEAARLGRRELAVREDLAQARLDAGADGDAVAEELAELVARHPLRERLRGLHMLALYRAGRHAEALASFARLRSLLVAELGAEPGPAVARLHQAILRQDAALSAEPDGGEPAAGVPANLPIPPTELVGRDAAVAEVRAELRRSRLVTLTGTGGVGKTRLAVEVGDRMRGEFREGVWLVELAGLRRGADGSAVSAERVAETIAGVLGLRENLTPASPAVLGQLGAALRGRRTLLVLDNAEAITDAVATVTGHLLRGVSGLRVLATSREPLGVSGERLWAVPALGIPDAPRSPGVRREPLTVERALTFGAVRLFVARAREVAPGFTLTSENVGAISELCRRLDGLPLALELAATRLRGLGPKALLSRMDDRFRLLTRGFRDAPPRQQTLRAVLDWSWWLLSAPERAVLRRLAAHPGGAGLAEAEAVCAGGGVAAEDVADLLARLVDRSLVVPEPRGGGLRYRLLESVAAYGLDQLHRAGEVDSIRGRHAEVYAGLAVAAEDGLRGGDQCCHLDELDREAANLDAALSSLVGSRAIPAATRLVITLTWYWFLRGRLTTARRALRAVVSAAGDDDESRPAAAWLAGLDVLTGRRSARTAVAALDEARLIADPAMRARALWWLGHSLGTVGDQRGAGAAINAALAQSRELGDRWGVAAALGDLASQDMATGDLRGARAAAAESAALFADLGDRWGGLQATFAVGALATVDGDYDTAERRYRAALGMATELGLWPEVSYQTSWLGRVALLRGELVRARELHDEALRVAVEQGFPPGEMYARTGLALGLRREGRLDEAQRHLRTLLDWHVEHDAPSGEALVLAELGFVAELRGDAATALRTQHEGLAAARRSGDPRAVALAVEGLAGAESLDGNSRRARRLLAVAARLRERVGAPLPAGERGDVDRIATRVGQRDDGPRQSRAGLVG
ncbi:AfsR/SARP family transcriptional regulator [Saccharomonospora piscinae]|nr:AfsR/SARP family transcriptional regulator [Saccharomonospora piscinae]